MHNLAMVALSFSVTRNLFGLIENYHCPKKLYKEIKNDDRAKSFPENSDKLVRKMVCGPEISE